MINMAPAPGGFTRLEFEIPSRGLIGYRGELLTDTKAVSYTHLPEPLTATEALHRSTEQSIEKRVSSS